MVRQSPHTSITFHGIDQFISLYCDDVLLYLGDAIKSTPHILSIFFINLRVYLSIK